MCTSAYYVAQNMCYQYFNTVATLFKFNVCVTELIKEIFRVIDSKESGLPPDRLTKSIILKAFNVKGDVPKYLISIYLLIYYSLNDPVCPELRLRENLPN